MTRTRSAVCLAAVLAATLSAPAFAHHKDKHPNGPKPKPRPAPIAAPCTGNPSDVRRIDITVAGQPAFGLYALPSRTPRGLVVFAHGYGHTVESWRQHIATTARNLNVVAVAMNYRHQHDFAPARAGELPTSRGWRVAEGADDSISVAKFFDATCPSLATNVMFGVSMGGNTAGLAVAAKPLRRNGKPLFDYLVDVEGAVNVTETYLEARLLGATGNTYARNAQADIEEEMGGTFESKRDVYLSRTVVNRVDDIKASGVKGVVVVHGVGDGLVPYNQSREFTTRLRQVGMKVDFYTALTRGSAEAGTTLDGYATGNVPGYTSPFAGHASETSTTHLVMRTAFDRLKTLYDAVAPACREMVVDGTVGGSSPHPITTGPTC